MTRPKPAVEVIVFVFFTIFFMSSNESNASSPRKLGAADDMRNHPYTENSPSPGPEPGITGGFYEKVTDKRCPSPPTKSTCHDRQNNITACLDYSSKASNEFFLIIQNDGEGSLNVNITITNVKDSFPEIHLLEQQAKQIHFPVNVERSLSMTIEAGNRTCIIPMGSLKPTGELYNRMSAAFTQSMPINGAYVLFLTALIVGGVWACYKLRKADRQLDGVQYQELEMEQPDSQSHNNVETTEGWDQGWDDGWEEDIEEVKLQDGHQARKVSANGLTSRTSDTDGWGNEWKD